LTASVKSTFYDPVLDEQGGNRHVLEDKLTTAAFNAKTNKDKLIVITSADNVGKLTAAEKNAGKVGAGGGVFSTELIFRACLRQRLDFTDESRLL
jgi:phosphopentomutase